jgi:dihydrofolate reductase
MRKIIVIEFLTLDGIMQAPGGPEEDISGGFKFGGWIVLFFNKELGEIMGEQMKSSDLLLGRKTYDIFASYWPQRSDQWSGINDVTKYVMSHEEKEFEWENSELITGNVVEQIKKLRTQDGPDLKVWGSGNFVQTLLKNDLVDELWLKIFPVVLGEGKCLFAAGTIPAAFKLIDRR